MSNAVEAVLVDIAGVLYDGGVPVPGSIDSIARLQESPVAIRFVTNTSRQSPEHVLYHLKHLGFDIHDDQLYTAPAAVKAYLKRHAMTCYALVHPNLDAEFHSFSAESPDAVVVADAGDRFDYFHLNQAFQFLMGGAELIAIGDNRYFRQDGELVLDAGPFVRALSFAAEKEPIIIGKPSTAFFQIVIDSVPCEPRQALMIGDDWSADCEGALRAGLRAALVRTGKYSRGDEDKCRLPGLRCAEDLQHALTAFEI